MAEIDTEMPSNGAADSAGSNISGLNWHEGVVVMLHQNFVHLFYIPSRVKQAQRTLRTVLIGNFILGTKIASWECRWVRSALQQV